MHLGTRALKRDPHWLRSSSSDPVRSGGPLLTRTPGLGTWPARLRWIKRSVIKHGHDRIRRWPTATRHRRTKAELEALDARIQSVLREDHPQSVRHVFYRLTDPTYPVAVPKSDLGYDVICRRCTTMRRDGRLPYGWLVDATRRGYHVATFDGAGDLIRRFAGLYRVDMWAQAANYVEVWAESRSIAGVIQADCEELGVSLYPSGGFASLSLSYQASEAIRAEARGRPVVIIYVGDYDPAGVLIDRSVLEELRLHLPKLSLTERRVAITADQAASLPSKPRRDGERREPDIKRTVEAEAMPAAELRSLVRQAVESYLPAGLREQVRAVEASEQAGLESLAELVERVGIGQVTRRD